MTNRNSLRIFRQRLGRTLSMPTLTVTNSTVNQSIRKFASPPVVRSAAARGLPSTPPTNRGVDASHNSLQRVVYSVDWVRFTLHTSRAAVDALLSLLGVLGALEVVGHGGTGFKTIESGLNGFQLYSEPVGSGQYLSFNLPGKFLQSLGYDRFLKVHTWLCEQGRENGLRFNYTRFDIAFDQRDFITAQFVDAFKQELVETRSREWEEIESNTGHTFYLGSRSSEGMLRVYDKSDGNSFGEGVPFTRVELELKGARAMLGALEVLAAPIENQHLMAAALLNGFCDVQADWWQEFKITSKAAWLKLRAAVSTVAKIEKWINKAVLPSLATLIAAKTGGEIAAMNNMFQELIGDGQRRWSARHVSMVANYSGDLTTQFVGAV